MSVHERNTDGRTRYVVRWREGNRQRSRTFTRKRDALQYDAEVERRRQLGPIAVAMLDAGAETLDDYVADVFAVAHMAHLAPTTRATYAGMYARHIAPTLGSVALRDITPEDVAKWQAGRLRDGVGPEAVRKSHALLGSILQRALEGGRISTNPARLVRKAKPALADEVRPLAPHAVEAMRAYVLDPPPVVVGVSKAGQRQRSGYATHVRDELTCQRDATLLSVLGYAGLRPGEALSMRWGHVRDRTIVVNASKTRQRRSVRVLGPLAADLAAWKLVSADTADDALVFPGIDGEPWTREAYKSWVRRTFKPAAQAAGRPDATPYTLRHSFASLLLHEGRSVIYVARQLGHAAELTLGTYGHVIEELDDAPQLDAEDAIRAARGEEVPSQFPGAARAESS